MQSSSSDEEAGRDNPTFTPDTNGHVKDGQANGETPDDVVIEKIVWEEVSESESEDEEEEVDPWKVAANRTNYKKWGDLTPSQKVARVSWYTLRIILVLGFLYLFICSLDFLSSAFKLLGGKRAGEVFQQSDILSNPVAGLMMGVLVTVLVQSSSTSTSIVISMVGANILTVKAAVYIIMGANIGTSVTNTMVALGQITNKESFRKAFSGATVHDMFNWLTVIVLLPLEAASGYLYRLSDLVVSSMNLDRKLDYNRDLLKVITKPFTTLVIQVSSSGIKDIAQGKKNASDVTLLKMCCDKKKPAKCCGQELEDLAANKSVYGGVQSYGLPQRTAVCEAVDQCVLKDYRVDSENLGQCTSLPWKRDNVTAQYTDLNTLNCETLGGNSTQQDCCFDELKDTSFFQSGMSATRQQQEALCYNVNSSCYAGTDVYSMCTNGWTMGREVMGEGDVFDCGNWTKSVERTCNKPCEFLFHDTHKEAGGPLSDEATGGILLVISLIILCICLVCIVKSLQSLLQGPLSTLIRKFVNANFPGKLAYLTGYLAILIGAGMTILVQSSSIFTSALTPLVGMSVIELERMYPLTLGSNIGTTATGILAALAQDVEDIPRSLQVALCHLFFNISGILIFYPFPAFRPPLPAAHFLGRVTADHRWFALIYLVCMFFLFPVAVFGLSMPGWYVLAAVLIPVGLVVLFVVVVKCFQAKRPSCLPAKLKTWDFLPRPLRSLDPYDKCMKAICFCKRFQTKTEKRRRRRVKRVKKVLLMDKNGQVIGERSGEANNNAPRDSNELPKGVPNEGFDGVLTTKM